MEKSPPAIAGVCKGWDLSPPLLSISLWGTRYLKKEQYYLISDLFWITFFFIENKNFVKLSYHLKFNFQLNPPHVISEAVTYSNVSSDITSKDEKRKLIKDRGNFRSFTGCFFHNFRAILAKIPLILISEQKGFLQRRVQFQVNLG